MIIIRTEILMAGQGPFNELNFTNLQVGNAAI